MGHEGVGHVVAGWGGMGHVGVGVVGYIEVGGSYRGGVGCKNFTE